MIRYERYLDFEAGKIDTYDVAEESVWYTLLWDSPSFSI